MAIRELVELASRVAEMERRFSGMMRHGTVAEVDTKNHRVRLDFGKDDAGGKFLSPWVPYAQIAGALKVHTPPTVGQQYTSLSPNGDWRQAVALPMTWSDQNASPSQNGDENVLTYGAVTIRIVDDEVYVEAPKITLNATEKLKVTAPTITLEGDVNLGGEGGKLVHRLGDVDSAGDTATTAASRVRAV